MKTIYTVGHSTRSLTEFMDLLLSVDLDILVDVRSRPRSRFPWFNKGYLVSLLGEKYLWMPSLGGLDDEITEGQFQEGLAQLVKLADKSRAVLMCSEKDFKRCHRHTKLEPELRLKGFNIAHL